MNITEGIPEAISFALSLGNICLGLAIVGCLFTLTATLCVLSFRSEESDDGPCGEPPVTVLKPLHDSEPELAARLAAFCRQDYGAPVQILCGAQHLDPASVAALRTMEADFPARDIELVVDPRIHGVNRKVSNLINMMPRARHETLVLSDSDIVVGPRYLRALTALLASPRIGAVTCLYHGIGGEGLWTRLSALAINSWFLPQAITAVSLGLAKPCCGATIAMRRSVLDRIGGFGALADILADDHALGVAIRGAGYEVVTAPFLVGHRCFEESLRQLVRHQMRVARTIKNIDPIAYAGTIVTHPWPFALLAMLSGSSTAALVAVTVLLSRVILCRCVEWRFGLARQNYLLIPVHDLIAFAIFVMSFFGATVYWRGADYRVAADGTLIEGQDLRGS
jgi:ceramide glucosyltransferase